MKPFLEALAGGPLLFDGAMGSLLYERGIYLTNSYDELNLSQPALIRRIHRDYLDAGADILETNTFGANRLALARHGHSDRTEEINRAAVTIAREAAGDTAYLAGAVGPTGVKFAFAAETERILAQNALAEQIRILVDAGVDLLVLETFSDIVEVEAAIAVARRTAPGVPVVAQMVFGHEGMVEGGIAAPEVARRLVAAGADVIGANCGAGPHELYEVATQMIGCGAPVAIQPNAGLPSIIDARTIYVANPEHFGVFARRFLKSGVMLIGGCCGTTPEHTRNMLGAVRMMGADRPARPARRPAGGTRPDWTLPTRSEPVPLAGRSRLGARLAAGEFAVSVELSAPPGTDPRSVLDRVDELGAGGVDIINIADGPRATARMSNLAFCSIAQVASPVEAILHVCCRDRSYLGLVSHLLGAHALGMRNIVIITGDPPKMGDYPFSTPVYDLDSIGLLELAAGLNAGIDPTGKELRDGPTSFVLATGAEPSASDYERELRRVEKKREAGAELIMTQPVYDPRTLDRFLDDVAPVSYTHLTLPTILRV